MSFRAPSRFARVDPGYKKYIGRELTILSGRAVKFVPGWDCHGLPIEIKALEAQREKSNILEPQRGPIEIRRAARVLATKTVKEQEKSFRQWAIMADWDNAWTTMDKRF